MARKKNTKGLEHQIQAAVDRGEQVYVFTGSDKTGITFERIGKSVMWQDGQWASAAMLPSEARVFIETWEHYWSGISMYANGQYVGHRTIGTPL